MGENGGKRPGAGRKKGGANQLRAEAERAVQWIGKTPMEYLQEVMLDEKSTQAVRVDAAKAAAPYVHKKQPQATEIITPVPLEIEFVVPGIKGDEPEGE